MMTTTINERQRLLSFGLVSDLHYGPEILGDRDCPGALDRLRLALRDFAVVQAPFIVNMGDAIDRARCFSEALEMCAAVRATYADYPGRVLQVVGNHDVEQLSKDTFLAHMGCRQFPYYSFNVGPLHGVVLDGNCHRDGGDFQLGRFSWDDAWISQDQLRWLKKDLADAGQRHIIVFCHECLDDYTIDGAPDPHIVRNAAAVREILSAAGVRAVITGHYHYGRQREIDGIPYITLPAAVVARRTDEFASVATLYEDGSLRVSGIAE